MTFSWTWVVAMALVAFHVGASYWGGRQVTVRPSGRPRTTPLGSEKGGSTVGWLGTGVGAWVLLAVMILAGVFGPLGLPRNLRVGAILVIVGTGVFLVRGALLTFRRWAYSRGSRVSLWSTARPGEVLVGVLHTGNDRVDPRGIGIAFECWEEDLPHGQLLWVGEIVIPAPTSPDTWPFHFSISPEAPASGISAQGRVVWRLRAESLSRPWMGAQWEVPVAPVEGSLSQLLPVPPPTLQSVSGGARQYLKVREGAHGVSVQLGVRPSLPGPETLVFFSIVVAGILAAIVGGRGLGWVFLLAAAVLGLVGLTVGLAWFLRDEVVLTGTHVVMRKRLGRWGTVRSRSRAALTGVRVEIIGPGPVYGVRLAFGPGRPEAIFDTFVNRFDAHEAARVMARLLGRPMA